MAKALKPQVPQTASQKRVIVTRPSDQADAWCDYWREQGVDALAVPVLDIVSVSGETQKQRIKNQILALDEYAIAIFVSQNAVAHGWQWIDDYWPQFPAGVLCLAVGLKTQQALAEHLVAHAQPLSQSMDSDSAMDSESLLSQADLQQVVGKKILIFRGCGGRTKLQDVLSERGAQVEHCELYERCLPQGAAQQLAAAQLDPERDIVALFSGESLQNFHQAIDTNTVASWQKLTLVVPSPRVQEQARHCGYSRVFAAENATEHAMAQTVAACIK